MLSCSRAGRAAAWVSFNALRGFDVRIIGAFDFGNLGIFVCMDAGNVVVGNGSTRFCVEESAVDKRSVIWGKRFSFIVIVVAGLVPRSSFLKAGMMVLCSSSAIVS